MRGLRVGLVTAAALLVPAGVATAEEVPSSTGVASVGCYEAWEYSALILHVAAVTGVYIGPGLGAGTCDRDVAAACAADPEVYASVALEALYALGADAERPDCDPSST